MNENAVEKYFSWIYERGYYINNLLIMYKKANNIYKIFIKDFDPYLFYSHFELGLIYNNDDIFIYFFDGIQYRYMNIDEENKDDLVESYIYKFLYDKFNLDKDKLIEISNKLVNIYEEHDYYIRIIDIMGE